MKTILITLSMHLETHSIGTLEIIEEDIIISEPFAIIALPDFGNIKDNSRIPDGIYHSEVLSWSKSFDYPHIWIKGVPNRSGIKIHIANEHTELSGCFAIGMGINTRTGGVTDSRRALNNIMRIINNDQIEVIVSTV